MGNAGAPAPQPTAQDLNDAYSQLLNDLDTAFFAASLADQQQLKPIMDAVTDVITALNAADFSSRDAAFTVLSNQVKKANTQLQTLQQQINGVISRITTAATIVNGITKVVGLAAQAFPHI